MRDKDEVSATFTQAWLTLSASTRTAPERLVTGKLIELGGGFEAWIFPGDELARVWRDDGRDAAVAYLKKYREGRIQDGGKDHT